MEVLGTDLPYNSQLSTGASQELREPPYQSGAKSQLKSLKERSMSHNQGRRLQSSGSKIISGDDQYLLQPRNLQDKIEQRQQQLQRQSEYLARQEQEAQAAYQTPIP